jgi:hypothetical protein
MLWARRSFDNRPDPCPHWPLPEKFPEDSIPWISSTFKCDKSAATRQEEEGIRQITQALKEVA